MPEKQVLEPSAEHPIELTALAGHVVVRAAGNDLAQTDAAISLNEAGYPNVVYVPLQDVDQAQVKPTDHHTYCPYKGDASYYSIPALGEDGENAIWEYREPHAAVAEIKDHVAFYTDRVDIEVS